MPNNNLSIYINNTVESDSGRYMCQVVLSEAPGAPKELTLDVMGKYNGTGPLTLLHHLPITSDRLTKLTHRFICMYSIYTDQA